MTILGLPRAETISSLWRRVRTPSRRALGYSWAVVLGAGIASVAMLVSSVNAVPTLNQMIPTMPTASPLAQSTRLYDVKGRLIATLQDEEFRIVIPSRAIPDVIRHAVIAIEDQSFFRHNGVEPVAVMRALVANVIGGGVEQGGSTITQQYVRNAFSEVGKERTLSRKAREALLAMRFEQEVSKGEILERYLNTVYFGRGAYGIEAAARRYFSRPAARLELQEAAYLAGLIHAPELYVGKDEAGIARRNVVLDRMAQLGFVTEKEAAAAKEAPLTLRIRRSMPVRAAYFVEWVRRTLMRPEDQGGFGLSYDEVFRGGLRVHTTLDLDMQVAAERAVRRVLPYKNDPEAALVAMTSTGEVRALVGGRNFTSLERARGYNFATQMARGGGRQPGSSFKPFTLLAYIREGKSLRRVYRAPARIPMPECANPGRVWAPANYGDQGFGSMDVVRATALSVNTVYAQMIAEVGASDVVKAARDAGIVSTLDPVCSLALGTFGVTPLELARAYATFSARGARPETLAVTKIVKHDGTVVAERKPSSKQTISRAHADKLNKVLEGVVRNGTGRPAAIDRPSAGKTGTTDERRDVWYAGYTPHPGLAAAVWIGYPPDGRGRIRPMTSLHGRPATGGYFAGRIWAGFMREAMKDEPVRSFAPASMGGVEYSRRRVRSSDGRRSESRTRDRDRRSSSSGKPAGGAEETAEPATTTKPKPKTSPTPTSDPEPDPEPTSGSTDGTGETEEEASTSTATASPSSSTSPSSSPSPS